MLNWVKANRKSFNKGEMTGERLVLFKVLLGLCEEN